MRNLCIVWLGLGLLFASPATAMTPEEERNLEVIQIWGDEIWGNGRLELVPEVVGSEYLRHEMNGTRVTTPEEYAKEIERARKALTFMPHAAAADGDLAWFRYSFRETRPGGTETLGKGIQVYRLEDGKLVETWVMIEDGAWQDVDSALIIAEGPGDERNRETLRLWVEEVWGKGRLELVPELVGPKYVRHQMGETTVVTPEEYAKYIEKRLGANADFVGHASAYTGDLVWSRFSTRVTAPDGTEKLSRGLQVYRLEDGKLVETWWLNADGAWPDM
jgi:predicted SnoaL-like aldol condensation-catalyzing enzyme